MYVFSSSGSVYSRINEVTITRQCIHESGVGY